MSGSTIRTRAVVGMFIVAASFIPGKTEAQSRYTSARNATVDARNARSVRIEAQSGTLRVEGQSGLSEVRVRGTARSSRREYLDDIKLTAERRGFEVFIRVEMPEHTRDGWFGRGNEMALDLVIEVPVSLPLDVDDGSGEASFINTGAISLEDGSGEVEIRGAHGDVDVTDGSGTLTIDGVEGNVRISDGSGEINARNVTGNLVIREDGSGDIDVSGVGGMMRVEDDGSGSIDVERIAGDFVVDNDGGGSIRYETVKGSVRIPERKRRG
jgi:hypothetical protein